MPSKSLLHFSWYLILFTFMFLLVWFFLKSSFTSNFTRNSIQTSICIHVDFNHHTVRLSFMITSNFDSDSFYILFSFVLTLNFACHDFHFLCFSENLSSCFYMSTLMHYMLAFRFVLILTFLFVFLGCLVDYFWISFSNLYHRAIYSFVLMSFNFGWLLGLRSHRCIFWVLIFTRLFLFSFNLLLYPRLSWISIVAQIGLIS